ncbi:RloB family protein [Gayadomonas joobiniege]|uniref:RloB family protein n=1 Tax=Gayadomonas joobiniege TaxID=1234606 RepID=UPI0003789569|nr:RloB family protein [Gayadomonas joobiniege]
MPKKKSNAKRALVPAFHIFCEGEKTEPYYIRGYIDEFHSDKKNILLVEDTKKNTPVQLVEAAIEHKKTTTKNDVYWVVFDRESIAKYPHSLHLEARDLANRNNIEIGFSNVCFEFWLLLHMEYSTASYDSCSDLLAQSNLKSALKSRGIDNYDKGFAYLFNTLKADDGVQKAIKNAAKANKSALDSAENGKVLPHFLNPYTDVRDLFIDMDNFINNKPSVRNK